MTKDTQHDQQKITLSKQRSPCPVASTLDLIGDKWTLVVVRDLLLGCKHYNEFLKRPENIATNILADRLSKLVTAGLVIKIPSDEIAGRDAYQLTALGMRISPLLETVKNWGLANIEKTQVKLHNKH